MKKIVKVTGLILLACVLLTGCGKKYLKEGLAHLEAGEYEEAIESFKTAEEKKQNRAEALRGIGMARWELGEYEAARNAWEEALENGAKRTATLYYFLGSCEMQLENPKAAINYYNLGLSSKDVTDEQKQEMLFHQIAAYEQCGDMESAKAKLSEYLESYPDDERALKEQEFLETQG